MFVWDYWVCTQIWNSMKYIYVGCNFQQLLMIMTLSSTFRNTNIRAVYLISLHSARQWDRYPVVKFSRNGVPPPLSGIPPPVVSVPPHKVVVPPPIITFHHLNVSFYHLAMPFRHHNKMFVICRPSVCPSHTCIVSKRLNVSPKFFHHLIGPSF